MKTLGILILVCINVSLLAQDLVIKSLKLDSLIFEEDLSLYIDWKGKWTRKFNHNKYDAKGWK